MKLYRLEDKEHQAYYKGVSCKSLALWTYNSNRCAMWISKSAAQDIADALNFEFGTDYKVVEVQHETITLAQSI